MSALWWRSTVYHGWQWSRSSGSSLSGCASYWLSQSNLSDICQSWSCDMQATSITLVFQVLPAFADVAVAVAHVAPKFLGLPQSSSCGWDARTQNTFLTHSFLFWPISLYLCEIRRLCPPDPAALSGGGNITLLLNGNLKTGPQSESPSEKKQTSLIFPDSVQTIWSNRGANVPNVWLLQAK